jgi:hypothetical protein
VVRGLDHKEKQVQEPYEAPTISTLGTVRELTLTDKCGGNGDQFLPLILSQRFQDPHCT